MIHPQILVLGYSEAAMLLRNPGEVRIGAVISIAGQREYAVEVGSVPHLILSFDDTEAPNPNDPLQAARLGIRTRDAAAIGLKLIPPSREDAQRIIDFSNSIREISGVLLCHCLGGVSRSAAAALICLATWTGAGHEDYCFSKLIEARACALPH